jgi:hypothetical protein
MTSKVRISLPPKLIEDARAAQYANRQRLSARALETKLGDKIEKRIKLTQESELSPEKLIGGTLEFQEKKQYKIRTKRRSFRRGFLLVPDRDYDSEGRLYVRSEDGAVQYATTFDPYDNEPTLFTPFELTQGKLLVKPYAYGGSTQSQGYDSAIKHTTSKLDETFQSFTLEYFVTLEAGPAMIPAWVNTGNGNWKLTDYFCAFALNLYQINNATTNTFLQVFFLKQQDYIIPNPVYSSPLPWTGLSESWILSFNGQPQQGVVLTTGGGEYHVAICIAQNIGKIYFDGSLARQFEFSNVLSSGSRLKSLFYGYSSKREFVYTLNPLNKISETQFPVTPRSGFRCYRFTPGQALYQGTSFTPPTTITDLA